MPVKTFEEACEKLKLDASTVLPDVSNFPEKHRKSLLAFAKMIVIAEAINDGWQADWNKISQRKWYPWFDLETDAKHNPSGFRFGDCYFGGVVTYLPGGSRLYYASEELAEYAAKQFEGLYRDMMT